nr:50S ribosomal protein L11 methyltransferase [Rhabdothermincola salaria]
MDLTTEPWVTLRVTVPAEEADLAAGVLWSAGVAGIEERSVAVPCPTTEGSCVQLWAGTTAELAPEALRALDGRWSADVVPVEDDAWLDAWKAYARPWRAGSRLVVVPAWQDAPAWVGVDDVVVHLDPGRAFGSGAHATTRLCMGELEAQVAPGARVLDVGCGSGVLAVAAALLGADEVVAVDIDPEAHRATTANAAENDVADRVRVVRPSLAEVTGEFTVVVANIGAATLTALAPMVVARTAPGGTVVLSGLLQDQVDLVTAAFEAEGAQLATTAADGEWRALVVRCA